MVAVTEDYATAFFVPTSPTFAGVAKKLKTLPSVNNSRSVVQAKKQLSRKVMGFGKPKSRPSTSTPTIKNHFYVHI